MIEPRTSSPRVDEFQRRVADSICRAMARVLDRIERSQELRAQARRVAQCTNAACRRARGCRGRGFGRTCE